MTTQDKKSQEEALRDLGEAMGGLQDVVQATMRGLRGGAPATAVPPLLPLPRSPILAAADSPPALAPSPFRAPQVLPLPATPPVAPDLPSAPVRKLRAIWRNAENTERIAADGAGRVAYESSTDTDAVGDPVWKRVVLPFSTEAEAAVAQLFGAALSAHAFVILLRTIATHECDGPAVAKAALAMMTAVGAPTEGEVLSDLFAVKMQAPPASPLPMPMTGEPVLGNVIEVQHDGCALLVVTCPIRPAVGDLVTSDNFTGRVRRVTAKDIGYDLLVEVTQGQASTGAIGIARPQV